jgi:mannose-1-phosphate guanylyltransferase
MAGGSGTRFWPHSRRGKPKQFLAIAGRRTLLQDTVQRLRGVVPMRRVLVVAPRELARLIRSQLPQLPAENLLVEPTPRGTAPCLVLAAAWIAQRDPQASMAVFPADHVITDIDHFHADLERAFEIAEQDEALVTFGIRPTHPETGYGYIEVGASLRGTAPRASWVRRFIEKPDVARARRFARTGRHFWNSGMFVWRVDVLRAVVERHARRLAALWSALEKTDKASGALRAFRRVPSVSIDVAVMERAERVAVIAARFDWNDVGSWTAVAERWGIDADGNTRRGDALLIECRDTLVYGATRLVAVIGARDLLVVDSHDAVLVCPRDRAQDVRRIVDTLARGRYRRLL